MGNKPKLVTDVGPAFWPTGYCYGGFRGYPCYPVPILDHAKTILLVRDPRDMLVSAYFSFKQSHVVPPGAGDRSAHIQRAREKANALDIDTWALRNIGRINRQLDTYLSLGFAHRKNVVIYRYEDVVFQKRRWLADLVDWFDWDVPQVVIDAALAHVDVFPAEPRPDQHIRQVKPGNHRQMLSPACRETLANDLKPYLKHFNYAP